MKDISAYVYNVTSESNIEHPPLAKVYFSVILDINSIELPSDADGELFTQRLGRDILDQVITQLRSEVTPCPIK